MLMDRITIIGFILALCVSMYSQHALAVTPVPQSIIVDINNKNNALDYDALDKLIKSSDEKHVAKYLKTDDNKIIISQKPIVITKHAYTPAHLTDLGLVLFLGNSSVMKIPAYRLIKT